MNTNPLFPNTSAEADTDLTASPLVDEVWPVVAMPERSASGQVWALGRHTLIVGDSASKEVGDLIARKGPFQMVYTDPPYGVAVVGGSRDPRNGAHAFESGGTVENDNLDDAGTYRLFLQAMTAAEQAMTPGAAFYVWHPSMKAGLFLRALDVLDLPVHEVIIGIKPHFVFGRNDYHWQHEPIYYGWKPGAAHQWRGNRKQSTLWPSDQWGGVRHGGHLTKRHPTQKPVDLAVKALRNHLDAGEAVYDPFAGAGSTLIAAEECGALGIKCVCVEILPMYADLILYRWEYVTGHLAERIA